MEKNNSAAKASIGYTIGNTLIRGLSFLTLPIFTRLMSTADYGLFTTYVAYESIIAIVVGLALHSSLKNAKIEYKDKLDEYVSTIQILPIIVTGAIILCSIPFIDKIESFFGFSGYIAILMVFQAFATSVVTMYNCRIGLDFAYKSYVSLSMILSIGNILLSLLFILTICKDNPFIGRVLGTSLPMILASFILVYGFFKKAKPKRNKEYVKFGLSYSLPLIPHGLSQILLAQFGKIIIQKQIGNEAAGIYGFAYTVALIPQILMQSLDMAWGPWFFEAYSANRYEEIRKRTNQYVSVFAIISIILFLVSPEIVKVMAAEDYWESITIVAPAILGVFFTFLYGIPAQIEYYYKKTNYIAIGTVAAALINVSLCVWLIPLYGYAAAVYVTVLTYILYFIAHMIIASIITKWNPPFETITITKTILIVCAMCVLSMFLISNWWLRYVILVITSLLYYKAYKSDIINIVLKKYPKDDK